MRILTSMATYTMMGTVTLPTLHSLATLSLPGLCIDVGTCVAVLGPVNMARKHCN
jgi:hypothetical protein